ncbi:MAG: LapA family protein [Thermoleophilia bacterium]
MQWLLIILGIILAIVGVFALQNPAVVTLRFLNLSTEASVLVVILLAYAAGVFSGILALLPSSIRKSGRLRKASSELRALQKREAAQAAGPGPLREAVAAAAATSHGRSAPPERVDAPGRGGSVDDGLDRTVVSPPGVPAADSSSGSPADSSEVSPDDSAEVSREDSAPPDPKPGRLGGFFR